MVKGKSLKHIFAKALWGNDLTPTDSTQMMAMLGAYKSREDIASSNTATFTIPAKIENLVDLNKIKVSNSIREQNSADRVYRYAKSIVFAFDSNVLSALAGAKEFLHTTSESDINKEFDVFKKEYKEANLKLVHVGDKLLEVITDPALYFAIKKHLLMAQIFMNISDSINRVEKAYLQKTVKEADESSENLNWFELGYFVAVEPQLVVGALNAIKLRDTEFINSYKLLVNKFLKLIARRYPALYFKVSGLDKIKFDPKEFGRYMTELENSRDVLN